MPEMGEVVECHFHIVGQFRVSTHSYNWEYPTDTDKC